MSTFARLTPADAAAAQPKTRITDGVWTVGSRLSSEPELMTQLGAGRSTVQEEVRTLAASALGDPEAAAEAVTALMRIGRHLSQPISAVGKAT
jgi:DNA-binding transcriptional MocR family regulator